MQHATLELDEVKTEYAKMWHTVEKQVKQAFLAVETCDKGIAKEVMVMENKVNAQELVVDNACERYLVLFAPVAVDLRFAVSMIKINNNLERIGDFADSLAKFTYYNQEGVIDPDLMEKLQWKKLTSTVAEMMTKAKEAFEEEDSAMARTILQMDDEIDKINKAVNPILAEYMQAHPEQISEMLYFSTVMRRIERIGDRLSNIAEDLVFYIDAKELRHRASLKKAKEEAE